MIIIVEPKVSWTRLRRMNHLESTFTCYSANEGDTTTSKGLLANIYLVLVFVSVLISAGSMRWYLQSTEVV